MDCVTRTTAAGCSPRSFRLASGAAREPPPPPPLQPYNSQHARGNRIRLGGLGGPPAAGRAVRPAKQEHCGSALRRPLRIFALKRRLAVMDLAQRWPAPRWPLCSRPARRPCSEELATCFLNGLLPAAGALDVAGRAKALHAAMKRMDQVARLRVVVVVVVTAAAIALGASKPAAAATSTRRGASAVVKAGRRSD
jgi:hypothetical protein